MSTNDSTPDPTAGDTNTCLPECSDWSGHVCPGSHPVASTPASEGLTEDEREALWAGIRRARHEDAPISLAHEYHKTHVLWAVTPVVERIIAARVADAEAKARAEAWEEAAEVADTQIVLWSEVPGLHPTEPEPHPAAIAASGARRTLAVLRSRMSEAFEDRAAHIARDGGR